MGCSCLIIPQHHNMDQSTSAGVIALLFNPPQPHLTSPAYLQAQHMYLVYVLKKKGKSWQLLFYDDITTVSDICVMAVSRLQEGSEAAGDTVSDVLWRHLHIQSAREGGGERACDCARIDERE